MAEVNSQADTQPSNGINTQSQQVPEADSWAKLVFAFKLNPGCEWLTNEFTRFGKLPDCDISPRDLDPELVKSISKIHFVIQRRLIRGASVAFIKDISSNGTYINGDPVGHDQTRVLSHKDTISVVKREFKMCRFYYLLDDQQSAPPLPDELQIDYHVLDQIASGHFKQVFYVLNKKTGVPAAMKVVRNVSLNIHKDDGIFKELRVLRAVKHANIIDYYNHILIDSGLYLFIEYVNGGDLSALLRKEGKLSEPLARIITKQIIVGIEYLHGLKIAHKNIQPKNILLKSNEPNPIVKIKNFRSCKKLRKSDASVETVGATIYDAPETKSHAPCRYDLKVDVWSFGVLLYICLCGREPMEGRENSAAGRIPYSPRDVWAHISCHAKKVVEASLNIDPKNRFASRQILALPWFTADFSQVRKRPNILSSNNSTPKKLRTNY